MLTAGTHLFMAVRCIWGALRMVVRFGCVLVEDARSMR